MLVVSWHSIRFVLLVLCVGGSGVYVYKRRKQECGLQSTKASWGSQLELCIALLQFRYVASCMRVVEGWNEAQDIISTCEARRASRLRRTHSFSFTFSGFDHEGGNKDHGSRRDTGQLSRFFPQQ